MVLFCDWIPIYFNFFSYFSNLIIASKTSGQNSSNNNNNNSNGEKAKFLKSKSIGTFPELDKKSIRKKEKMERKKMKEEERKQRKSIKENNNNSSRNRSRSKGTHSSLEDFAQQNGNPVPLFIEKCIQFIEQEGLDMEGIYRVPGNRAHVDTLLLKFDESKFRVFFGILLCHHVEYNFFFVS